MKNFKNLFSLIAVAAVLLFAAQACKKASAEDNIAQIEAANLQGEEQIVSEEWLDTQVDEIYESEAGTPSVTIGTSGVTLATDSNGDASCAATPTYKYKDQYIVGTAGSTLTLTMGAACVVDSIVNTNSKSGKYATDADAAKIGGKLVFSDLAVSPTANTVTVKLAQAEGEFKTGSAKMTVYMRVKLKDTSSTFTEKKSKSVTIKVVGKNSSDKLYGTNAWGLLDGGVTPTNLTAAGTTIDSASFVPTKGDVIIFGADKFRGVIDSVAAPTTSTKNGIKYKFYYTAWNAKADCKSSKARKSVSKYAYTFKPSGVLGTGASGVTDYPAMFVGPDGTTKATKFVR